MPERVPPSKRTKEALRQLFTAGTDGDVKSELVRLSIRQIVEQALEGATRDLLGRDYDERRADDRAGARNGYRPGHLQTAEGEVAYSVPQVRDVDAAPIAAIRERVQGRTDALKELALEMYARCCSTRDIESIFRTDSGESLLSRTAVSEITEALWAEYEEFTTRDLSEIEPLYVFLDGLAERLRPGAKREAILCAWAINVGRTESAAPSHAGDQGIDRLLQRTARRPQTPWPEGSGARRDGRRAGIDSRGRRVLSVVAASTVSRAQDAKHSREGAARARGRMAADGPRRLRSPVARVGKDPQRRPRGTIQSHAPCGGGLLRGGLRRLHCPPALPTRASETDEDDESSSSGCLSRNAGAFAQRSVSSASDRS
jgi:mutator family transposase